MATPVPLRPDFDASSLRRAARQSRDASQTRRLLALAAIYEGGSRSDAARIGGMTLQIVRAWVVRFNAKGMDGLVDRKSPGTPSRLGPVERQALVGKIEAGPIPSVDGVVRWRLVDLAQWVFEEFRIPISVQTLSRELRALGYRKLSARPRHHAQNEFELDAFKKTSQPRWQRPRRTRPPANPWRSGSRTRCASARRTRSRADGQNEEPDPRRPRTNVPPRPICSARSARSSARAPPSSCRAATPTPWPVTSPKSLRRRPRRPRRRPARSGRMAHHIQTRDPRQRHPPTAAAPGARTQPRPEPLAVHAR